MFGVSYMEMVIIGLIALIVVGPEQLPVLAARLGRLMRTLNMARWDLTRQFDEATRTPLKKQSFKIDEAPTPSSPEEENQQKEPA